MSWLPPVWTIIRCYKVYRVRRLKSIVTAVRKTTQETVYRMVVSNVFCSLNYFIVINTIKSGFMCNCCMQHAAIIAVILTKAIVQLLHKNCT